MVVGDAVVVMVAMVVVVVVVDGVSRLVTHTLASVSRTNISFSFIAENFCTGNGPTGGCYAAASVGTNVGANKA